MFSFSSAGDTDVTAQTGALSDVDLWSPASVAATRPTILVNDVWDPQNASTSDISAAGRSGGDFLLAYFSWGLAVLLPVHSVEQRLFYSINIGSLIFILLRN